jgi:flagellar motor switch protein FliM
MDPSRVVPYNHKDIDQFVQEEMTPCEVFHGRDLKLLKRGVRRRIKAMVEIKCEAVGHITII